MLPQIIHAVPQRLQFGSFELDPQLRELRKRGLKIKTSPQAFCVLLCLLDRPGELITREELFQKLWPADTHVEFEGNLNAIIRVLREALGDSARNPRFIETEPKVGYRFIAPVFAVPQQPVIRESPEPQPAMPVEPAAVVAPKISPRTTYALVPLTLLFAGWMLWPSIRPGSPAPQSRANITQLTHFLGSAGHPSFSPDGTRVAFHWNGDERGDDDIYVMRIGAEDLHRLTKDPANDTNPAWSPDGRDIAFLRSVSNTQSALMMAPAIGGTERTVAVLPRVRSFTWSPDGQYIAYSLAASDNEFNPAPDGGISAISLSTGQTLPITASAKGTGDSHPSFSRDGRKLAFVRRSDLWMLPIDGALRSTGPAVRLTFDSVGAQYPVWTRDGSSLIFAADRGVHGKLRKIAVDNPNAAPQEVGGEDAFEPAIDAAGSRLVYSRSAVVDSLNTIELCGAGCTPEAPRKLVYSTKLARNPSYSPDGRRIAFESSRSGHMEIWICDRDGSNPRQLTNLGGVPVGTPNWSPDGTQIVFDARLQTGSAILVIPAAGGAPRQLTSGSTEDLVPSWSHDGTRIYFCSKRTGTLQVWSMSAGGDGVIQITRNGGFRAVESHDGKLLYFSKGATNTAIWKIPAAGGEETLLIDRLSYWQNFSVIAAGIYFVPVSNGRTIPIHFYDVATGSTHLVGTVDSLASQGISASPDNHTLVFSRRESNDRDLMLMELSH